MNLTSLDSSESNETRDSETLPKGKEENPFDAEEFCYEVNRQLDGF